MNGSQELEHRSGGGGGSKVTMNPKGTLIRKGREPYRATRLWMEAVAIFRKGVPLGKHRRQWRTYDDTFIASEAITWFQSQLQYVFHTNRGPGSTADKQGVTMANQGINRQQTLMLLQKMFKARIFTTINAHGLSFLSSSPTSLEFINESDFKDNGQLYRLNVSLDVGTPDRKTNSRSFSATPSKSSTTNPTGKDKSLASTSNYSVIIRPLSLGQINAIWEQFFMQRFSEIVTSPDVVRTLYKQPNLIPGHWIAHNLTEIGKYGIVSNKGGEDLPRWLILAMKCMAYWPNHHPNEQPNYPGFENDVFKLIADYFNKTCLRGKGPLLTIGLYEAFVTSFIHAELFDFNTRLYAGKNASVVHAPTPTTNTFSKYSNNTRNFHRWNTFGTPATIFQEEQYPFNASESIENLLLDILTPQTKKATQASRRERLAMKPKRILSESASMAEPLTELEASLSEIEKDIVPAPQPMQAQDYEVSRYSAVHPENPACYYYETAFTNDSSPLTRVVSKTELQTSFGSAFVTNSNANQSSVGIGASFDHVYAYENPTLDLSGSELIHHPKYSKLVNNSAGILLANSSEASSASTSTAYSFGEYSTGNSLESNQTVGIEDWNITKLDRNSTYCGAPLAPPSEAGDLGSLSNATRLYGKLRSFSAWDLSDNYRDRSPYKLNRDRNQNLNLGRTLPGNRDVVKAGDGFKASARKNLDFYYGADACIPGLMTREGKQMAIQSFRLLTLLIPPVNRRQLQLLFRCMAKMARNDKLMLDVAMTTRAIVVNTFFKHILYSFDDNQFDELLALRIVTFMMDNDSEIFCVKDEAALVESVQDAIREKQIIKEPNQEPAKVATPKRKPEPEVVKRNLTPEEKKVKTSTKVLTEKSAQGVCGKEQTTPKTKVEAVASGVKEKTPAKAKKAVTPKAPTKTSGRNSPFPRPAWMGQEDKENDVSQSPVQYCSRITLNQFEDQKLLGDGGTGPALRSLLHALLEDPKMNRKQKKERLDQFVREYPHIFIEKFGDQHPDDVLKSCTASDDSSLEHSLEKSTKQSKSLNPFNKLFKNLRL